MRIEPLGDQRLILRDLPGHAWAWADSLNRLRLDGLYEAYASFDTVCLEIDPNVFRLESLGPEIDERFELSTRTHVVPVCYEHGLDLESVANLLEMSPLELILLHSGAEYRCEAVGFCPGFPYLSGLHPRLHGVPRLPSPRKSVPVGSVAITGAQAGVYPMPRPGGWSILGRTPLIIVEPSDGYFPIKAGDVVRFHPIDGGEFERLLGERLAV